MTFDRVQRRLAAILAADAVGYSRQMSEDETGTRERFKTLINEIVRPALNDHQGRLFKEMGDGFLAEFGSVVDAVDCAVFIQETIAKSGTDAEEPIILRIGVNLGDVIVEDEDLHGDGVNVAARLEALAEPGGICISRAARDQIRDKLAYSVEDLGDVEVKNIPRGVRAFRVRPGPAEQTGNASTAASLPLRADTTGLGKRSRLTAALISIALLLSVTAGVWVYSTTPTVQAASVDAMVLPLPKEPSVAVLPFEVVSAGEGDQAFANALTQDLTRGLARISGLFVIANSSTQNYAGKTAPPAQVAEDLGVAHVVRASFRRHDDRVRIDAEMIDALSGRIIFSQRYDHPSDDLFEMQDQLVQALATRLSADLDRMSEQPRFTTSPEAYLLWAQADHESWINTPDAFAKAQALAKQALDIDPSFLRARGILAFVETQSGWFRVAKDPEAAVQNALLAARQLVEAEPDDWYLQAVLAQAVLNVRDYEDAVVEYDRAIEMEPAQPRLLTRSSLPLIFLGRSVEAEQRLRVAIRLNPFHDWLPNQLLGQALFIQERYLEAAEQLDISANRNPRFIGNKWWRAATHGRLGNTAQAREAVTELLDLVPNATISKSFIQISDEAAMERYRAGLRAAGLPE